MRQHYTGTRDYNFTVDASAVYGGIREVDGWIYPASGIAEVQYIDRP